MSAPNRIALNLASPLRIGSCAFHPQRTAGAGQFTTADGTNGPVLGRVQLRAQSAGAEYLVHEIWPLVRQRLPSAQLRIAGKHCELIRGEGKPPEGVQAFWGFVPDLEDLYAQTRVVACPILSGGGTRIKIIEGALQGRPVASTTLGAEGLNRVPTITRS